VTNNPSAAGSVLGGGAERQARNINWMAPLGLGAAKMSEIVRVSAATRRSNLGVSSVTTSMKTRCGPVCCLMAGGRRREASGVIVVSAPTQGSPGTSHSLPGRRQSPPAGSNAGSPTRTGRAACGAPPARRERGQQTSARPEERIETAAGAPGPIEAWRGALADTARRVTRAARSPASGALMIPCSIFDRKGLCR